MFILAVSEKCCTFAADITETNNEEDHIPRVHSAAGRLPQR
jgi:hypothetical protein